MKKIYIFFAVMFATVSVSAQCSDLFFSEYAEGSSNHKYLEIFNPTDASIDLSGYSIFMINNGGTANNIGFQLYGSLDAKGVFILSTNQADSASIRAKADTVLGYNSVTHFNGDDAVMLIKGTDTIDIIGERWVRSNWTVGTGSTKDYTLVRKSSVGSGQTDWTIGATEWDVYPKDDWTNLGSHRSVCTGIQNPGFDINEESYKIHWKNRDLSASYNEPEITSSPIKDGVKASKLRSDGSRVIYQAVTVKPMTAYTVKFWYTIDGSSGSGKIAILDQHTTDATLLATNTIASTEVTDMTDKNVYVQDSVTFTSVGDVIAIYGTSSGVTTRFDAFEIVEGPAAPPVVAAIQNPGFDIEGDDSYRDFWRNRAFEDSLPNTNLLQITSSPIQGGVKAGKLPSSGDRIIYQAVDVEPNTDYVITYWYTMKTSPTGSAKVSILGKDLVDPALAAANTIASSTVNDQTDANTYIKDSIGFNSGSSTTIAIYVRNTDVETRFDTWDIYEGTISAPTSPMTAAADPTADAVDVISLFSNVYTDVTVNTWRTGWSNATLEDVQVAGNDVKKYSALDFVGIETVGANSIDASGMDYFTFDAWTADATTYRVKLVDFGADNGFGGGDDTEHEIAFDMPAQGSWTNHTINISDFTNLTGTANISQIIFSALPTAGNTLFIDNVYFSREPVLTYNVADIADATGLDADFAPVKLDTLYELTGVVYGIDYDGNEGLSFTIIDATGGINIFNWDDVSNYVVTEGDEITARGKIGFYNGLLELLVDSIRVNSTGNTLAEPTVVDKPSEATESNFIQLTKVWLVDNAVTAWPDNGNVDLTNGTDTFQIRIDRDIPDMVGVDIAYDTMTITGIGGQFDGSAPYDEGYQIFPRGLSDIEEWERPVDNVGKLLAEEVKVYPNPASEKLSVSGSENWTSYEVYTIVGTKVASGELYNNSILVSDLAEGTYILKLNNGEKMGVARFMKSN